MVTLVGALAALAIYSRREDAVAFGLVPASATTTPVITSFRTGIFAEKSLLQLNILGAQSQSAAVASASQAEVVTFNPQTPPPVQEPRALNTNLGGEIALFWHMPVGASGEELVKTVNIYRQKGEWQLGVEATMVAAKLAATSYTDNTVEEGKSYSYKIVSVVEHGGEDYEAMDTEIVMATAADTVAPTTPSNVMVVNMDSDAQGASAGTVVKVSWENPLQKDFDHVAIFRSTQYGVRGAAIKIFDSINKTNEAKALVAAPTEYLDQNVQPNTTYYYTIVAYDAAGNASAGDFSIPTPGNLQPFVPIVVPLIITTSE